jgi:hypothetical protein
MNFHLRRFGVLIGLVLLALFAASVRAQETWTARPASATANLWSAAYGSNQWVAVGEQVISLMLPDGIERVRRSR